MSVIEANSPIDLSGNPRRQRREKTVHTVLFIAAAMSIVISVAIVVSLFRSALDFFVHVPKGDLWTFGWFPRRSAFDIKTLLVGTMLVTGIAMIVAIPLGLGSAIYLSEYATTRTRKVIKPILEILAGIPSVVLGFFAVVWLNPEIVQKVFTGAQGFNLAAAGLGVGVLITPLVATVSEDALRAVPRALREASFGLGAKRVQTSLRVVIPAGVSGIVASIVIATSRAIGETMVVAIAAGGAGGVLYGTDVTKPGQTITSAMASLARGSDQIAGGAGAKASLAYNSLFFLGLLLFFITLVLNMIGNAFVRRVQERY